MVVVVVVVVVLPAMTFRPCFFSFFFPSATHVLASVHVKGRDGPASAGGRQVRRCGVCKVVGCACMGVPFPAAKWSYWRAKPSIVRHGSLLESLVREFAGCPGGGSVHVPHTLSWITEPL